VKKRKDGFDNSVFDVFPKVSLLNIVIIIILSQMM
jgi:hypothetical protein